ncbi:MAG: HD domain-containing protein [Thermoplasmata archaeon]|nr:MAG: HD domain-containing protein [Thermoplasmata archaeon]
MFSRTLTEDEINKITNMVEFIKDKHQGSEGHDYSHVLEVCRYSIKISQEIKEEVDPFIVITGALLHDIGRVHQEYGGLHGLMGGAIAEEYLEGINLDNDTIETITRIIVRHSPTSMLPPISTAEKIVFDADALDRLGWMGMIRGVMGKRGSIEEILERTLRKRSEDYHKLNFDVSKEIGKELYDQSVMLIKGLRKALDERTLEIENLKLPR